MVDKIKEENLQNSMQPVESLIPENEDRKENDENRITMSGPSMRPQPQPQRELTPAQIKAQEKINIYQKNLRKVVKAQETARPGWQNTLSRWRLENTLAKNPTLRNALFTYFKGDAIAFNSLPPKTQLTITKQVQQHLRNMAKNAVKNTPNLTPDPKDVTNYYNQANPNNLANTQLDIQRGIEINEANKQAQIEQDMMEQQYNNFTNQEQEHETETAAISTAAAIVLSTDDEEEIIKEQQANQFNPSPKPSNQNKDDDKDIEEKAKHAGEETALRGVMSGDKELFKEGAKGIEKAEKTIVDHELINAGMALTKALASSA